MSSSSTQSTDTTHRTQRVAVVTGAARGIGAATALRLAQDGNAVAVLDLDEAACAGTVDAITTAGGRAIAVGVDVSKADQVEAAVARVADELGAPTILVNNAGISHFGPFLRIDLETWQRVLDVNLTGTYHCCQVVVPHMIAAGWGRIVNISSSSTHGGQPMMSAYVSAKSAVIGLTKSLALELGPKGITVNTIPPGFIDTPMLRDSEAKGLLGPGVEAAIATTPVRRIGRPDDIAAATAFLVSEEASYVTGQVIGVNGGRNT